MLADQDSKSSKKQKRHDEIKKWEKKNNFVYATTEANEIENLIAPEILKGILKDELKIDKDKVDGLELKSDDYKEVGLGEFIMEKYYKGMPIKKIRQIKGESGTLKYDYKTKFSIYVHKKVEEEKVEDGKITWDDIAKNQYAKNLIENIFEFIKTHNGKFSELE